MLGLGKLNQLRLSSQWCRLSQIVLGRFMGHDGYLLVSQGCQTLPVSVIARLRLIYHLVVYHMYLALVLISRGAHLYAYIGLG